MKRYLRDPSRCILAILIFLCIFGNLFPFLNIDLGFVILTPLRVALVLISIYCLFLWYRRFRQKKALAVLKKGWLEWAVFGFFVLWLILGAGWIVLGNVGSGAVTEVIGILTIALLAFCCFTLVRDRKDISYFLHLLVLSGIVLALLACAEVIFGSFVPGTKFYLTLEEKIAAKTTLYSPTTVFYNPNDFAAFMLACMSIVCYWVIRAETWMHFLGCLALLLLIAPTVLTNSSIFFILTTVLMLVTMLALMINRSKPRKIRLFQISTIAIASLLFILFGIGGIRSAAVSLNRSYFTAQIQKYYAQNQTPQPTLPNQNPPDSTVPQPTIPDLNYSDIEDPDTLGDQLANFNKKFGTIHIRKWLIIVGLDYFTDSPVIGNGPDSFHQRLSGDSKYLENTSYITNPHCFYIELLSQYGIVLFVIYMAIALFLFIRSGILAIRELRRSRPGWGLLCLFLIATFSAVILMPSGVIRFSSLWIYLILAVCVFSKGLSAEKEMANE